MNEGRYIVFLLQKISSFQSVVILINLKLSSFFLLIGAFFLLNVFSKKVTSITPNKTNCRRSKWISEKIYCYPCTYRTNYCSYYYSYFFHIIMLSPFLFHHYKLKICCTDFFCNESIDNPRISSKVQFLYLTTSIVVTTFRKSYKP